MNNWKDNLKRWLDKEDLEKSLADELKLLSMEMDKNEEELEERFYKELEFGTAGLRGVLGAGTNRMNIYTVKKTTQGLSDYILEEAAGKPEGTADLRVAIGYDSRINSRLFAECTAEVLAANGIRAYMYEELSTVPALSFAVRKYGCNMGVMITASHNPSKYNGYKVYNGDGYQVTDNQAAKILEKIGEIDIFEGVKALKFDEIKDTELFVSLGKETVDSYMDSVFAEALFWTGNREETDRALKNLKVVYSPLNGAGNKPVREIMRRLGIEKVDIVEEQELPDGNFPTCPYPNPEKREALVKGLELAEKTQADILIATDPDCDRVGIAARTEKGDYRIFTGNEVGLLLFEYIINCRKGGFTKAMPENPRVVRTIVTSSLIDKMAEVNGVEVKITLTGFKYIGEFITALEREGRKEDYIFGFEESYGYLSGTHARDKDGVNASMLICLLAAQALARGKTLNQELTALYEKYGYCENYLMDFEFPGISGMAEMALIISSFREDVQDSFGGKRVTEFLDYKKGTFGFPKADVVEYRLEDGSGFAVRPSGTEPKLKIYVFAKGNTFDEACAMKEKLEKELRGRIKAAE